MNLGHMLVDRYTCIICIVIAGRPILLVAASSSENQRPVGESNFNRTTPFEESNIGNYH